MTKVNKIELNNNLTLWVTNNWVIMGSGLQYMRFSIYSTNNARNYYAFKKELLALVKSGDKITASEIIGMGVRRKVNAWATSKPTEQEES